MAPTYRAGLGPTFLEPLLTIANSGGGSGVCVATTDGDGAPAPVANCYWIKEADSPTATFEVGPANLIVPFTPLAYEWPVIHAHRIEGTLSAAHFEEEVCRFDMDGGGGDVLVDFDPLGANTFRYRIGQIGGGATYGATYNTSTNYGLRFEFNSTTCKFWVNGSLDISLAVAEQPIHFHHVTSNLTNVEKQYWCGFCWRGSDDIADRPNTTVTVEGLNPSSDNESAQYGGEAGAGEDCADAAKGLWSNWDDDGGDDSDTTIYNCAQGGANAVETSHIDDLVAMASPKLMQLRMLGQANAASKEVVTYARIVDATPNVSEVQHQNVGTETWRGFSRAFPLAPDGGAWTEAKVNATRAGIRTVDSNAANDEWAMMRVEVFDLGDDPPVSLVIPDRTMRPLRVR